MIDVHLAGAGGAVAFTSYHQEAGRVKQNLQSHMTLCFLQELLLTLSTPPSTYRVFFFFVRR